MIYLAVVEITDGCNLKCSHCYEKFKKVNTISLKCFRDICIDLKKNGCKIIRLSGGEPCLLGDKLFSYVNISKEYFDRVEITTNGTIDIITNNIDSWKLFDAVQISIDGTHEVHDSIRGKGSFYKSWGNLLELKRNNIPVNIMMTIGKHNKHCLKDVYNMVKLENIEMYVERLTCTGRANENMALSKQEIQEIWGDLKKLGIKTSDPLYLMYNQENIDKLHDLKIISGCSAGVSAICIASNKDVFPCPRMRVFCGNLQNQTLKSILSGSIIKKLENRENLKGKCGKCKNKWICGGCRADSYARESDIFGEDFGCFYECD